MPTVDITLIESEGNVRLDLGDLTKLAQDIDRRGLIQPITVAPRGEGYTVIDGHRRLQACKDLGEQIIDVHIYTFMEEEADRISTQYQANMNRKGLTAFEQMQVTLDMKAAGYNQGNIADELGISKTEVSMAQKTARAIPKDKAVVANRMTEEGLFDLVDRTDGDVEITSDALILLGEGGVNVFSAVQQARSGWKMTRFLEENEDKFKELAAVNVTVGSEGPSNGVKWAPINVWPGTAGQVNYGGKQIADLDVVEHRLEVCHMAWLSQDWSGDVSLIEACKDPDRHLVKGDSTIKSKNLVESSKYSNEEKERQKRERKEKVQRKADAVTWLTGPDCPKVTGHEVDPYLNVMWEQFVSADMAQAWVKGLELEKVYVHGGYSAKETLVEHVKTKYRSPASRTAYVALLFHGYQFVNPWDASKKKLGGLT